MNKLIAFHSAFLIQNLFGIYYDLTYVAITKIQLDTVYPLKGRSKFLTFWCLLIQTFYFALCLAVGLTNSSSLRKIRDRIHSTIAFPLALFVGITFWSIYFYDRELVFPRALDPYFPVWLNHLMHTNIVVFQFIETSTTYHEYPKRSNGLKALIAFMAVYLIWMHVIYFVSGFWVYPIMEVLNTPLRLVFFLILLAFISLLYIFGEQMNATIWAKEQPRQTKKKHKK